MPLRRPRASARGNFPIQLPQGRRRGLTRIDAQIAAQLLCSKQRFGNQADIRNPTLQARNVSESAAGVRHPTSAALRQPITCLPVGWTSWKASWRTHFMHAPRTAPRTPSRAMRTKVTSMGITASLRPRPGTRRTPTRTVANGFGVTPGRGLYPRLRAAKQSERPAFTLTFPTLLLRPATRRP
jgi:hypothetical protein